MIIKTKVIHNETNNIIPTSNPADNIIRVLTEIYD